MKKQVSLQQILFQNLTSGPIILGLTLLTISIVAEWRLKRIIAAELTGRAIAEMDSAFVAYLEPVNELVEFGLQFGQAGYFETTPTEELDTTLAAMLETFEQVSSIHVSKASGESYMLLRKPDGNYYSRLFSPDKLGWIITREWDGIPGREEPKVREILSDYDTRQRAWFQDALAVLQETKDRGSANFRTAWTDPYVFFTTKDKGITASIAYITPSGGTEILAFDILLNDILNFAEQAQVRSSGIIFVLLREQDADDLNVIAVPFDRLGGPEITIPPEFPLKISQLVGAPRVFVDSVFSVKYPRDSEPFRFELDGQAWWGATARSYLTDEKEIWIAATIPEKDVLEGIPGITRYTLLALLVTLVAMTFRARILARRYGAPIGELVTETERIGRLNFTQQTTIESPIYEIQVLASTQAAMRRSLGALTAMNDRGTIARELRMVPRAMQLRSSGAWEVALWDDPARPVGGCFPMTFPIRTSNAGGWSLAEAEDPSAGIAIVLATTQLNGMQAARHATALRAIVRALLQQTLPPEALLSAIQQELTRGAGVTAPTSLLCAEIDGPRSRLEVACNGRTEILLWQGARAEACWLGNDDAKIVRGVAQRTLALAASDRIVIVPDTIFDILNRDRHRLRPSHLEQWLADLANHPAATIARKLGESVREFADAETLNVDLTIFAISRASSNSEPHGLGTVSGDVRSDNIEVG